jgi:cystine transport system substrate-binding protein
VLGQAQTPRKRLLGIAAIVLAVLSVPTVGAADPTPSAESLRRENASLASLSHAALLSVYSLDARLERARTRLVALDTQTRRLRAEQASLRRQLTVAHEGVAISQRRLASRLRLLYEQHDVTAVEVVLGSKTLDDALTALDNLDRVAALDETVLAQVRSAKRRLTSASTALADRAARLAAARRDAAATAAALDRTRSERQEYIARLASQRQLNEAQIERIEAQARAARVRTERLLAAASPAPSSPVAVPAAAPAPAAEEELAAEEEPAAEVEPAAAPELAGRTMTVTATGYSLPGTTATGLAVGWGVAAVDPNVIPLGTTMTVPGYGTAVAADTGGAVVGATIDLWFPTVAQASAWGRRTVTVVLR